MAEYLIEDTTLINLANIIRQKTGSNSLMTPLEMISVLQSNQEEDNNNNSFETVTLTLNITNTTVYLLCTSIINNTVNGEYIQLNQGTYTYNILKNSTLALGSPSFNPNQSSIGNGITILRQIDQVFNGYPLYFGLIQDSTVINIIN